MLGFGRGRRSSRIVPAFLPLLALAFLCAAGTLAQAPLVQFRRPVGFTFHPIPPISVPVQIQQRRILIRQKALPKKIFPLPQGGGQPLPDTLEALIEQANGAEAPYESTYGTGVNVGTGVFPDLSAFDYKLPSLLPGALVSGDAKYIVAGQLVHLPLTPAAGTVSMGGVSVKQGAVTSVHVDHATLPNLAGAVASLQTQAYSPDQNTEWVCSLHDSNSSAYSAYKANVSFGYLSYASFSNLFSSADNSSQHHLVISCQVQIFTVSFLPDTTPNNVANAVYFDPATTVATASEFIGVGKPPLVVSSVTYGAQFFMTVDSTASSRDMEDAMTAAFSYAGASGKIDFTDTQKQTLSQSEIHVLSMGGRASASAALGPVFAGSDGPQALVAWLKGNVDVGASSGAPQETGVPISYQLSYLDSNPVGETATILGTTMQTTDAKLTNATIQFQQEGNGKGHGTLVDIYLEDANQKEVQGYQIGNNSTFTDNSLSPMYTLQSFSPTTEAAMAGGFLHMRIHPSDHDVWKFTASLILKYSDGTVQRGQVTTALSSDNTAASSPGHQSGSQNQSYGGKELRIPLNNFVH